METLDAKTLDLIPVNEAAKMLGIRPPQIKQLQNDNYLLIVTLDSGTNKSGQSGIPRKMLQPLTENRATAVSKPERPANRSHQDELELPQATYGPLWNLRGTITLLRDLGFSSTEVLAWLWKENDALGEAPIDALIAGRHHRVNNEAVALGF